MNSEFSRPNEDHSDQQEQKNTVKLRENCADVIGGASQGNQFSASQTGAHPELANKQDTDHSYPRDQQKWPENKTPTK